MFKSWEIFFLLNQEFQHLQPVTGTQSALCLKWTVNIWSQVQLGHSRYSPNPIDTPSSVSNAETPLQPHASWFEFLGGSNRLFCEAWKESGHLTNVLVSIKQHGHHNHQQGWALELLSRIKITLAHMGFFRSFLHHNTWKHEGNVSVMF